MSSFDELAARIIWADALALVIGLCLLFAAGRSDLILSYALGCVLGMFNFHLHVRSVRAIAEAARKAAEEEKVSWKAALGYFLRFGIVAAVFIFAGLELNLNLLPAAAGFLITYAVLLIIGIMETRGGGKRTD